jgi:hypothetical protein
MATAAIALGLVATLGVAKLGRMSGGGHSARQPPGAQAGAMPARLVQIAYVQTSAPIEDVSLSTPVSAHPVDAPDGGYEIAVSFAQRVSVAGSYSAIAHGPGGQVLHAFTMSARGHTIVLRLGAGLPEGVYRGMVALVYAENPALLEDSETVYRPVGVFQVRVP